MQPSLTTKQRDMLRTAVKTALPFIDKERLHLSGLLLSAEHVVATDGHRLFMHKLDYIEQPPSDWRQTVMYQAKGARIPDIKIPAGLDSCVYKNFCLSVGQAIFCQNPSCGKTLDAPSSVEMSMLDGAALISTHTICKKCFTKKREKAFIKAAEDQGYRIEATRGWLFDELERYNPVIGGTDVLAAAEDVQLKEGGVYADGELLNGVIGEFPDYKVVVPTDAPRWQLSIGYESYKKLQAFKDEVKRWNKTQPKEDRLSAAGETLIFTLRSHGDKTGVATASMKQFDHCVEWEAQVHTLEEKDKELKIGIRLDYLLQAIRAVTNTRSKSKCHFVLEFGSSHLKPITTVGDVNTVITMPTRL